MHKEYIFIAYDVEYREWVNSKLSYEKQDALEDFMSKFDIRDAREGYFIEIDCPEVEDGEVTEDDFEVFTIKE